MSTLNLHLKPLKALNLSVPWIERQIKEQRRITSHLSSTSTIDTPDQIADLRRRVRKGYAGREIFDDYTSVARRESRLLTLYLIDLAVEKERDLLPPLDNKVFTSILGDTSQKMKKSIRRQASLLYFTHFCEKRIPSLNLLTNRLRASWKTESESNTIDKTSSACRLNADILFCGDAPSKVAAELRSGESLDQLMDRFGIPSVGEFRERLFEEVILGRVRRASVNGTGKELDDMVIGSKERRLSSGYTLGAEAVRILIDRSITDYQGKVPAGWKEQLVTYACDPRIPNAIDQTRWWGWASKKQKETAIRALTELTLRQFITLLRESLGGTAAGEPFEKRADMLLKIFDLGKVIDARLAVHEDTYRNLSQTIRQVLRPLKTSGGPQHTSFICLKCDDDVWLIEGTHSFALRGFLGEERFPIPPIWDSKPGSYFHDEQFRVKEIYCDLFQRHHNGAWLWDFNHQLRQRNIIWRGL